MDLSTPSRDCLDALIDSFRVINYDELRNGNIIYLYIYHNRKHTPFINEVHSIPCLQHFEREPLRLSLMRVAKNYKYLVKHYVKGWTPLIDFLYKLYQPPITINRAQTAETPIISTSALPCDDVALPTNDDPTPALRRYCNSCSRRRQTYSHLRQRAHLFRLRASKNCNKMKEIYQKYSVKDVNKYKNRKESQLQRLKDKIIILEKENLRLQKWLAKLQKKTTDIKNLKRSLRNVKSSAEEKALNVKELKGQLDESHKSNDLIRSYLSERDENEVSPSGVKDTTRGKSYSLPLRLCLYKCLLMNVSTECAGPLTNFIYNTLTGNTLSYLPSPPTVGHMSYELAILTHLQAAEFVVSAQSSVTLSWDATTVGGSHINEIHVSRKNSTGTIQNCTIQVEELSGGTANDYATHIVNVFSHVATIYSKFKSLSYDDAYKSLTTKIGSIMTDRCAVNDATGRLVRDAFDSELLSLKCLVHPLDTVASESRACLKKWEVVMNLSTSTFGKDCAAANVLLALNTLRFKAGMGDPKGISKYFQEHGVPTGLLVRYVGNRLHVLFHMASVVYLHRKLLIDFLNPKNGRDSTLKRAILSDLQNTLVMAEFQALGLIGKIVTGPWMSAFYRDGEHMDAVPKLQCSYKAVQLLQTTPHSYLSTTTNVFGEAITDTDAMSHLQSSHEAVLPELLKDLSSSILKVFERQLCHYLPGGKFSEPSTDVLQKSSGAPLHNMASERTLGMADHTWRRAPNARIGFISGKTAARTNHMLTWFLSYSFLEQNEMINFVVPLAYKYHQQCKRQAASVSTEIIRRHKQAKKKKEKSDRKTLEAVIKRSVAEKSLQGINDLVSTFDLDIDTARDFILNPSLLIGKPITHTWEEEEEKESVWNDKVHRMKRKNGSCVVVVDYWALDADEATSVAYDIKVEALLADMLVGDLSISA